MTELNHNPKGILICKQQNACKGTECPPVPACFTSVCTQQAQGLRLPVNPLSGPCPPSRTTSPRHPSFQSHLTPFSVINSLLQINHELPDPPELFHQDSGYHPLANAGMLYLTSLGFHFRLEDVALEGVSHYWATTWSTSIACWPQNRLSRRLTLKHDKETFKPGGLPYSGASSQGWARRKQ